MLTLQDRCRRRLAAAQAVAARLKVAEALAKELTDEERVIDGIEIEESSGNVYADPGNAGCRGNAGQVPTRHEDRRNHQAAQHNQPLI